MNTRNQNTSNKNKRATDPMKYEIANEFGVELGPDTTARANGSVGGEITKRLVSYGKQVAQQGRTGAGSNQ
ncbi:TPA: alpha/beta-type small acid-soluble spore protein [bacterium]|jgi:hypothetical protein|nr:alpha/beta-type small acid-soluble spore protein [bacterium]